MLEWIYQKIKHRLFESHQRSGKDFRSDLKKTEKYENI